MCEQAYPASVGLRYAARAMRFHLVAQLPRGAFVAKRFAIAASQRMLSDWEKTMDSKREPTAEEIRLVIGASAAGTAFEWYDF